VEHPTGSTVVAVVADGLGGHPRGEMASALAVDTVLAAEPMTVDELIVAVHEANQVIVDSMSAADGSVGMGTTVAAVLLSQGSLAVVNVGDSVVFELVDGRLVQLSIDDVPDGAPGAIEWPSALVTQTLGGDSELIEIEPHVHEDDDDRVGDRRLLMCTDGLTNFVAREQITDALRDADRKDVIGELIAQALAAGAPDNVTVMTLDVHSTGSDGGL
jgi:PPM family protein phosphatase